MQSVFRATSLWIILHTPVGAQEARLTESPSAIAPSEVRDAFQDERNPIRVLYGGERLDLWSLKPPEQVRVPDVATHPIDALIRQSLQRQALSPAPEADRRTLIRRLTFDLTGLPPTPDEVKAFEQDASADAWEQLVDRLLNSVHYGERQARLWLDVVRYADTNGYERDEFRPLIWKYRDYVVRSFNADKPYSQFVIEQLAGDELVPGEPQTREEADALIATGYLRLGQWDSTASIFQEEERLRSEVLADLTNTTASAFLGLTYSCCQCHDHKYDPLSHADHYRLRAFFAASSARDDLIVDLPERLDSIRQHNQTIEARIETLQRSKAEPPGEGETEKPENAHAEQIRELEITRQSPDVAMGCRDVVDNVPDTCILQQGDYLSPSESVDPGFPSVLWPGPATLTAPHAKTTGRRLALAQWITNPQNPWTARVIVNRIWQQHFGTGLVATPNDFGYTGARPVHPELLDWLAIQLIQDGWSIRRLHRLILLSETYRQQSSCQNPQNEQIDPDNRLLWRQNAQRLDAETLRDSLLAVSGLLRDDRSGKPRWPEVPEELLHAQPAILEAKDGGDGGRMQGWYTDPPEAVDVRSLYVIRKRCLPVPFLQSFDLPDSTTSCGRRDVTVVAPQALMLLNSPEGLRCAAALADRVERMQTTDSTSESRRGEQIRNVFALVLQREPDAEEQTLANDFLHRHQQLHLQNTSDLSQDAADRLAFRDLCRALLNLNEFLYVD